jgi:peptidoglycan-N-acetylglucosamine deacetylase
MTRVLLNRFPGGKQKAVTLSYDDGQIYDLRLAEIFNKASLKGTFHINSANLGKPNYLKAEDLKVALRGHEVSSHAVHHPHLEILPPEQLAYEILEDRRALETAAGYPVRGMSYPFGSYNSAILSRLPALGIEYSRTCESHGNFNLPDNWLRWHPTCHHSHNLKAKTEEFIAHNNWNRLAVFYVWGHSFEFARQNNWELIEDFANQIKPYGDQFWFATNIEIYDYVEALRQTRVSVDGSLVLNRSSQPLWVEIDEQVVKIEPGQLWQK